SAPGGSPSASSSSPGRLVAKHSGLTLRHHGKPAPIGDPTGRRHRVGINVHSRHYREIEVWRITAAVLVVVIHCWQNLRRPGLTHLTYPFEGNPVASVVFPIIGTMPDLFFAISSFLLTRPILAALLDSRPLPHLPGFLRRRVLRVLPICWIVFTTVWVTRNFSVFGNADLLDLLEHLTFTQDFDSKRIFYTDGPAWSMSVEVQFYFFLAAWALVVDWLVRARPSRNARAAVVGTLLLAQGAGFAAYSYIVTSVLEKPATHYAWYYSFPGRGTSFTGGMVLALIVAWRGSGAEPLPKWVGLACRTGVVPLVAWLLLVRGDFFLGNALPPYLHEVAGIVWTLMIADSVLCRPGRVARGLQPRWAVGAGALTMSLYLWHEPLLITLDKMGVTGRAFGDFWFNLAVVIPIGIGVSWLSLRLIEEPAERITLLLSSRHGGRLDYPQPTTTPAIIPAQSVAKRSGRSPGPSRFGSRSRQGVLARKTKQLAEVGSGG
ncbi:MAG: acyltransferase 3, partial [Frankiales bacterium]|nr:acyltransferase 3 [Frankiales bacterium]